MSRRAIYCIDIVAHEPIVRLCDPRTITVIRRGNSNFVHDADIIVEDTYQSPGWIIDNYYDDLTENQIKQIDRFRSGEGDSEDGLIKLVDLDGHFMTPTTNSDYSIDIDSLNNGIKGDYYDSGNIRVVRVVWASLRKVGIISWTDDDGYINERVVDETYEPNQLEGEQVKWTWIKEYWETTRIAKDIYIKMKPRPVQFRRIGNISAAYSGYVGITLDSCIMDIMKPYQYMYNIFFQRVKQIFATDIGKAVIADLAFIPDGWSFEKWMYFLKTMRIAVQDSFKTGNQGAATGKLAGNMQQNNRIMDAEMGSYIQQHIMMMQYLEERVGDIVGISRQREGSITSSETVGGVERSVTQSSHITETWFALHDSVKEKVLETLLETAKYVYRNRKEPIQYVTSDMTRIISELDGDMFIDVEFGVKVSNSSDLTALLQSYRTIAERAVQNGTMSLTALGTIYSSKSMRYMMKKIEQLEQEAIARQEAAQTQQLESNQNIAMMEDAAKTEDRLAKQEEYLMGIERDLEIARINAEVEMAKVQAKRDNDSSRNQISIEAIQANAKKLDDQLKIKSEELRNKREEIEIKRKEIEVKKSQVVAKNKKKSNK